MARTDPRGAEPSHRLESYPRENAVVAIFLKPKADDRRTPARRETVGFSACHPSSCARGQLRSTGGERTSGAIRSHRSRSRVQKPEPRKPGQGVLHILGSGEKTPPPPPSTPLSCFHTCYRFAHSMCWTRDSSLTQRQRRAKTLRGFLCFLVLGLRGRPKLRPQTPLSTRSGWQ